MIRLAPSALTARLACLGEVTGGEVPEGPAWTFWAAGRPSVAGTLRKVEQQATPRMTLAFYHGLRAGLPRDEAVREAMLAMKKNPGRENPYYCGIVCALWSLPMRQAARPTEEMRRELTTICRVS